MTDVRRCQGHRSVLQLEGLVSLKDFDMTLTLPDFTIDHVRAAHTRIKETVQWTPFLMSRTLSEITGAEVWVKFENLQFTASFKERGACNKMHSLTAAERAAGVIAMSAGNHAQGVAYMASLMQIPATIVMPENTPFIKVKYTERFGARVILSGQIVDEAAEAALEIREREGLTFVHPYDDFDIMAGQGTVALEMLADVPDLEAMVIPIGGGGLIAGCAVAAHGLNPDIDIVGVETELYPSMTARLQGESVPGGGISLAEGIAVKNVGQITAAVAAEHVSDIIVVPENCIEQAINLYLTVEKTVSEGAGAAGLAALLTQPEKFKGQKVGLIICGGNIDQAVLASVIMRGMVTDNRLVQIRLEISDRPGQLAEVSTIIGQARANILEVNHQRLFPDVSIKKAELDILLEARDAQHVEDILAQLKQRGYGVRVMTLSSDRS